MSCTRKRKTQLINSSWELLTVGHWADTMASSTACTPLASRNWPHWGKLRWSACYKYH